MQAKMLMLVALTLLIASCDWRDNYEEERQQKAQAGLEECSGHGQKLLAVYLDETERWKVVCYQESPYLTTTWEV
jgi:hypothetical protein